MGHSNTDRVRLLTEYLAIGWLALSMQISYEI